MGKFRIIIHFYFGIENNIKNLEKESIIILEFYKLIVVQ